jgi:hypothetical protein
MSFSLSGVGSTFASTVDVENQSSLRASSGIDEIDNRISMTSASVSPVDGPQAQPSCGPGHWITSDAFASVALHVHRCSICPASEDNRHRVGRIRRRQQNAECRRSPDRRWPSGLKATPWSATSPELQTTASRLQPGGHPGIPMCRSPIRLRNVAGRA